MFSIKLFISVILYCSISYHPVHVSVTNMEYDTDRNEIHYSIKVFKDDFQLLFVHLNQILIDFNNQEDIDKNIELIKGYFDRNIRVEINNQLLQRNIVDYTISEDAVWFSFNAPINEKILSIKLINTVLLDLYFDQKNLLIFKAGDFENGYRFDIKNKEYLIAF